MQRDTQDVQYSQGVEMSECEQSDRKRERKGETHECCHTVGTALPVRGIKLIETGEFPVGSGEAHAG